MPYFASLLLWIATTVSASAQLEHLDLNGKWQLQQEGKTEIYRATVPGNVHTDLLADGRIPEPFFRDNERKLEWIFAATWIYERSFSVPETLLHRDAVLLRCEGLDTAAKIEINGQQAGEADNMYRTWEFDVKPLLRSGNNTIKITFSPMESYIKAFSRRAPKVPNATGINIANIRKAPYSNGWDFGPKFLTCGIYKKIELLAYDTARISDVRITQDLSNAAIARLGVEVFADQIGQPKLKAEAVATFDGKPVGSGQAVFADGVAKITLNVPAPKFWWPAGMGAQPLYHVGVRVRSDDTKVLDATDRRIGLRKIELLRPKDGNPLRLSVNGKIIFAKGANYIPSDVFPARVPLATLRRTIADAVSANMNMLRFWGGGYYEEDGLFDACDEMGIMIWEDLKFACAPYPGNNPEFQENVRNELRDQVRRLRHHPSIAVWAGNNEVHGLITGFKLITQEEYDRLFHAVIGTRIKDLDPAANYVGGSPEEGDEHNWWVWHVGADFERYRESHGWMTEFGFQSFPEPATVAAYTQPNERDSVFNEINMFHQRNGNQKGNEMILNKMKDYFREPKDFDSTLWLSQINQAYGMTIGIEHWRTDWPNSSGSFVWQLNDCWPGPSWSSIDYFGRWKAAQYAYRRVFAPVMLTGDIDQDKASVQLKIASDLPRAAKANVEWQLTDLTGKRIAGGNAEIPLPAGTASTNGPRLNLFDDLRKAGGKENALLWLNIDADGKPNSRLLAFVRPKELDLKDPNFSDVVEAAGNGFDVTVSAAQPALWTWLACADPDARYSDNFFELPVGKKLKIHVVPSKPIPLEQFKKSLRIRSLFDTYSS